MKDSCWISVINVFGRGRRGVGRGVRSVFGWLVVSGRVVVLVLVLLVSVVVPVGAVEGVLTPSGLSASSVVGGVLLEWDAPVADSGSVTGYRVLRRRTDVGEQRLSQLVRNTEMVSTSYLDESVVDGGTYIYRVRAMRGGERSAISDKATVVYEVPPAVERAGLGEPEFEVVWSSVLTVGALPAGVPGFQNYQGPSFAEGSLLEDRFVVDGEPVWVVAVFNHAGLVLGLSDELPRDFVFRLGSQEFVASDSFVQSMGVAEGRYWWPTAPMGWSEGDEVELSIAISVSGSMPQRPPAPPSGVFDDTPVSHDGVSQFEVRLLFDHADLAIDAQTLKDHGLAVAGAEIAEVRKYSRSNQSWIVTLQPTGPGAVTITLPATTDCAQPDAICATDGRKLRARVETTIPGSADATSLRSLNVQGAVIDPVFDPEVRVYTATAAVGVSKVTVDAAGIAGTAVTVSPADADATAAGHQVALGAPGTQTAMAVVVSNSLGALGSYAITVTRPAPDPTDPDATRETAINLGDITGVSGTRSTTGTVNNGDDQLDYYKFRIRKSKFIYVEIKDLDVDAGLYIEDTQGNQLKIRDSSWTSQRWLEIPVERGTYFILVKAAEDGTNSYTLRYRVRNQTDDYALGNHTRGTLDVNGSSTGSIEFTGDRDWFASELTAGQTYWIEHKGSPTGHGTLTDTEITGIFDSGGQPIRWTSDEDSGVRHNARVVFTPTASGTYYIEASAYKRIDWDGLSVGAGAQGTYTVFLSEYTSDDDDDHSNLTDTTGTIEVGSPVEGEIETIGDQDWFAVDLTANQSYRLNVTGAFQMSGQLTLGYGKIYGIYDDEGNAISDPVDRTRDANWIFRPSASGKYFVSIGAADLWNLGSNQQEYDNYNSSLGASSLYKTTIGTYQLAITEQAD